MGLRLGFGCAEALAKAGVSLTICARTKKILKKLQTNYLHIMLKLLQ